MNLAKRLVYATILAFASAGHAQTCGTEIVFDMSPLPVDSVWGEYMSITSIQGQIIHARLDATFVSNEENPWSIYANFEFPTGIVGVDSQTEGWKGTGTFSVAIESDALNGFLVPPSGSPWVTWFLIHAGGTPVELPGGGIALTPMDGLFSELKLTLTLADCPTGDLNADLQVNIADLLILISEWGTCPSEPDELCQADLTADGTVNVEDLLQLIMNWGSYWCPPPFC